MSNNEVESTIIVRKILTELREHGIEVVDLPQYLSPDTNPFE